MSSIQTHRAVVGGLDSEGQFSIISANIPNAEISQFSGDLRSLTQGRARFEMQFSHYEPVPFDMQKSLVSMFKNQEELV